MLRQSLPSSSNGVPRREFLKQTIAVTGAASLAAAAPLDEKRKSSETLVTQLYGSLTESQKKLMAFPFGHALQQKVDNNWHITKARVGEHFNADQQALIREIFLGLHSPEYADRVMQQVEHDNRNTNRRGGFSGCSVAVFGEPGTGKFEFVLAGRHVTRRCDGDSVAGTAFGGPIFYGHAAAGFNEKPDHPGNIYWYQAKRANALFEALDGSQRKRALRSDPRDEAETDTVRLPADRELHGIPLADLTADQKQLAREVMADVLAPFRKEDVAESMKLINAGGFDQLHMAYYKNLDVGNDGVWDVWQLEGPSMVWYFRGHPHVHTWVHIKQPANS